jgi:hypothetical protein
MKNLKNILTILIVLWSINCFGQFNKAYADNYMMNIDSNTDLLEGISEGEIEWEGKSGGFEDYDLLHPETYELYRIIANTSLDVYTTEIYYYQNHELIYAKTETSDWSNNKLVIELQEVYFYKGKVAYNSDKEKDADYLYKTGLRYLEEHNKDYIKTED